MPENPIPDVAAMERRTAAVMRRLTAVAEEAAAARVTRTCADTGVSVTVDGTGRLCALVIPDAVVRGPHPTLIGPTVIELLGAVRVECAHDQSARVHAAVAEGSSP